MNENSKPDTTITTNPFDFLLSWEMELDLQSLIFNMSSPGHQQRWRQLKKEGVLQLTKAIQKHAPSTNALFQKTLWRAEELVLAFYEIDYLIIEEALINFTSPSNYMIINLISIIDKEKRIYINLVNYIISKGGKPTTQITLQLFEKFLKEKEISFPTHWPSTISKNHEVDSSSHSENYEAVNDTKSAPSDEADVKKIIKEFDLKRFSINELKIIAVRAFAAARWKGDDTLSQTDIVDDPDLSSFIELFYSAAGQDYKNKDIRSEWITSLDPREDKKGGRPKKQK